MIISNGTTNLICVDGFMKDEAIFIRISDNELIIASRCLWHEMLRKRDIFSTCNKFEVSWGSGRYFGPVGEYLKNLGN